MTWFPFPSTADGPKRHGHVVVLVVALAIFTSTAVSMVWTRLRSLEYGYKISKASRERSRLLEINRRLRIEAALLKRPERISRIASEELGLEHPRPDQIRRLRLPQSARARLRAKGESRPKRGIGSPKIEESKTRGNR